MANMLPKLTSEEIQARMFHALSNVADRGWVEKLSGAALPMGGKTLRMIGVGAIPDLRVWKNQRMAHTLRDIDLVLRNVKYELTLQVDVDDLELDLSGQIDRAIKQMMVRYENHWAKLLLTLIQNGHTMNGYDNVPFFSTSHTEGGQATGSNDITSTGGAAVTAPNLERGLWDSVAAFNAILDDAGEPAHLDPKEFVLMYPATAPYMQGFAGALNAKDLLEGGQSRTNTLVVSSNGYNFLPTPIPPSWLPWTDMFALFVGDGMSLIRGERVKLKLSTKAEGSEFEMDNDAHQHGLKTVRGATYGNWQSAVRCQLAA